MDCSEQQPVLISIFSSSIFKIVVIFTALFLCSNYALATDTISSVSSSIKGSVSTTGQIVNDICIISGISFVITSFYKFHSHNKNPQQVPLASALILLVIGAVLLVFPFILQGTITAAFGFSGHQTTTNSTDTNNIIMGQPI